MFNNGGNCISVVQIALTIQLLDYLKINVTHMLHCCSLLRHYDVTAFPEIYYNPVVTKQLRNCSKCSELESYDPYKVKGHRALFQKLRQII